ncbi:MAG TPA: hypothetical protein VFZ00_27545 [Solirubrobacter sp.]|nr:hypothetical protein [Solirubrobacter sp.]
MTVLGRALSWFIAPPPADAPAADVAAPGRRAQWRPPSAAPREAEPGPAMAAFAPPTPPAPGRAAQAAVAPAELARSAAAPGSLVADRVVTSAAVLGRAGEVEPVAAALALALRRHSRAKAATVALVRDEPEISPPDTTAGGSAAARRIVARLDAHGFEAEGRGRLAWVALDPADEQFAAVVRRVTLVAAPAVLAITAPRTRSLDEALAEQDLLVVVTADPGGPLAQLVTSGPPPVKLLTVRPLPRGPRRALARAGLRAPRRLIREITR